ncbi:hypothetical protein IFM89_008267 [Coptis chinensis]|uniref:Xyloglucan endotransglucosylase/hydrolase n=1 Tax=Coptis chinensis TaxID=261450 RepID=A0A835IBR5_9MAGN|nr:hypothetical protein IFM89_008267 [Coptis chinensis]
MTAWRNRICKSPTWAGVHQTVDAPKRQQIAFLVKLSSYTGKKESWRIVHHWMKMGTLQVLMVLAIIVCTIAFDGCLVDANISKSMYITWGAQHASISTNGEDLQLTLDQTSGSAVQSKKAFLFGSFEMLIKLVPGNSAGTVTAYYVSSGGDKHDEIDFEFLGNTSGQPYIIHTNIYTMGNGSKEQQFYPWFDPSADYHNYTIHWNPSEIVWFVDGIPIRVFRNYENMGIPYPNKQGMRAYSSLWNADNWATRGGLVKIDWNSAPFKTRLSRFRARACKFNGPVSIYQCAVNTPANWWNSPFYSKLSYGKMGQMKWVRDNYMIYDYCKDTKRFHGQMPAECSKLQF